MTKLKLPNKAELAKFIRQGHHKAVRATLEVIESNSEVKVVAVDEPNDTIIFGFDYLDEQEVLLDE